MTNTKFRLLEDDTIELNGTTLYRIEALRNFSNVKKGEKGGYIDRSSVLADDNYSWIHDNSKVYDNSSVCNSVVYDNSIICHSSVDDSVVRSSRVDDSRVHDSRVRNSSEVHDSRVRNNSEVDNSSVHNNSEVDNSSVHNNSSVYNSGVDNSSVRCSGVDNSSVYNAAIYRTGDCFSISSIGSENGILTAFKDKSGGISVTRGCFKGTLKEFAAAVEKKHGDNEYARTYRIVIDLIKNKLEKK